MPKPILDRIRRPSYWYADQLPHWGIGLAISAAVTCGLAFGAEWSPVGSVLVAIAASQGVGVARELIQNWRDEPAPGSTEDTTIDMAFWSFGALVGAIPAAWA